MPNITGTSVEKHFDKTFADAAMQDYSFDATALKAMGPKDRSIVKLLQQANLQGKSCLDIGPGTGRWLSFVKQNGASRLVGVDISAEALSRCAHLCDEQQKVDLEKEALNFADNSFDVIVSIEVLEHLREPQNYLNEIVRTAKPGATVVMSIPNIASFLSRVRLLFGYLPSAVALDPTHVGFYCQSDLTHLLAKYEQKPSFIPTSFSLNPFNRKSRLRISTNSLLSGFDDNLLFTFKVNK